MKAISGFFISFTPEEKKEMDSYLIDCGYQPDGDGLKKMVLDICKEPQETAPGEKIADLIRSHPELISGARTIYNWLRRK